MEGCLRATRMPAAAGAAGGRPVTANLSRCRARPTRTPRPCAKGSTQVTAPRWTVQRSRGFLRSVCARAGAHAVRLRAHVRFPGTFAGRASSRLVLACLRLSHACSTRPHPRARSPACRAQAGSVWRGASLGHRAVRCGALGRAGERASVGGHRFASGDGEDPSRGVEREIRDSGRPGRAISVSYTPGLEPAVCS